MNDSPLHLDALIVGGGIAGLWTLHELLARGRLAILVEPFALGQGQTIWSQGIIHGGLKYTLQGLMSRSAEAIAEMPAVWRACLTGAQAPRLPRGALRAPHCHIWRTGSLSSQAAMLGARVGLRVAPVALPESERPPALRGCPGIVARLDEQVVDPAETLAALAGLCAGHVCHVDTASGLSLDVSGRGAVREAIVRAPGGARTIRVQPDRVVLTAGAGNGPLREQVGLDPQAMQIRPLHMVLARGPAEGPNSIPVLNGHCVDGSRTRVTITTAIDSAGKRVWQIGGEVAERGVSYTPRELIAYARGETVASIPGLVTRDFEWSTYRADRAEAAAGGRRPDDATVRVEGDVISAWPTKLALAPRLAELIADVVCRNPEPAPGSAAEVAAQLQHWPAPAVARAPWETATQWIPDSMIR